MIAPRQSLTALRIEHRQDADEVSTGDRRRLGVDNPTATGRGWKCATYKARHVKLYLFAMNTAPQSSNNKCRVQSQAMPPSDEQLQRGKLQAPIDNHVLVSADLTLSVQLRFKEPCQSSCQSALWSF